MRALCGPIPPIKADNPTGKPQTGSQKNRGPKNRNPPGVSSDVSDPLFF
jgi:hypothetical protein